MANRYWVGDGGSTADTAHWSATSGGAGGVSVPTAFDDVIFDINSFSIIGQIVMIDHASGFSILSMDWSTVTNSPEMADGTATFLQIYGNLVFSPYMVVSYTKTIEIAGVNDVVIDMQGLLLPGPGTFQTSLNNTSTLLVSPLNMPERTVALTQAGTFDTGGFQIDAGALWISGAGPYILDGSLINLIGPKGLADATGVILKIDNGGNTISSVGAEIHITVSPTSYGSATITSGLIGGTPLNIIESVYVVPGTSSELFILNFPGLDRFTFPITHFSVIGLSNIYFGDGGIYDFSDLTIAGGPGNQTVLQTLTPGTQSKIISNTTNFSYISVKDLIAQGTAVLFDASNNGVDLGNNINWTFTFARQDFYLQNVFMVGSDTNGKVQMFNVGKADDFAPIFYELETQELEFGNRAHLKKIADEIGVLSYNGLDSNLAVRSDTEDYKPVPVDVTTRVAIGPSINTEGHYFTFKWFGQVDSSSPILEGIYLENVTDFGVTQS